MRYTEVYIKSFKRILLFGLSAALVVLSACGASPTGNQEVIAKFTLPPVEEETVPTQGGTLTFPIPENPETNNPLKIQNVELHNLYSLIYEQPVRIGIDGMAEPELAETWGVDSSGTIWTFNLRKGVNWQNGHGEFTSADIIYTLDLIKSYTKEDSLYASTSDLISDYKAVDEYTVAITLSEPGNAAFYLMTFPVVCKDYSESVDIDSAMPVGTGPYVVESYDKYEEMVLHANDSWWKQAPYIQDITAVCYPDHDAELIAFEENLFDIITTSVLTVQTYERYNEKESIDYITQYYDCLVPNAASRLFNDANVRKAIAYGLDKREIISKALLGHAVAADYPVVPDSYLSGESSNIYEYNLQKAQTLLEEAGWRDRDDDGMLEATTDGADIFEMTIKLLVLKEDDTYRIDVAENIAAQLKECGIDVEIDPQEAGSYKTKLESGSFDLALCSFYLDQNPDISFMIKTDSSTNYGGFSDEGMDLLLSNCRAALDAESMRDAYLSMENYFIETIPQISLYFRTNALIYDVDITVDTDIRDLNIFNTIPRWYIYTEDTIGKIENDGGDTDDTSDDEE